MDRGRNQFRRASERQLFMLVLDHAEIGQGRGDVAEPVPGEDFLKHPRAVER